MDVPETRNVPAPYGRIIEGEASCIHASIKGWSAVRAYHVEGWDCINNEWEGKTCDWDSLISLQANRQRIWRWIPHRTNAR